MELQFVTTYSLTTQYCISDIKTYMLKCLSQKSTAATDSVNHQGKLEKPLLQSLSNMSLEESAEKECN